MLTETKTISAAMENTSMSSYCPDFSDIYEENYEFWDFLNIRDNSKDTFCSEPNNSLTTTNIFQEEESSEWELPSGGNVPDLSYRAANCDFSERKNTHQSIDDLYATSCQFFDFLNDDIISSHQEHSPNNVLQSTIGQETHQPVENRTCFNLHKKVYGSPQQLNPIEVVNPSNERFQYSDNTNTPEISTKHKSPDEFWDFLKFSTPAGEYQDVLSDVISSTMTPPLPEAWSALWEESPFFTTSNFPSNATLSSEKYSTQKDHLPCISSVFSIPPYPDQFRDYDFETNALPQTSQLGFTHSYNNIRTNGLKHKLLPGRKADGTVCTTNTLQKIKNTRQMKQSVVSSEFAIPDHGLTGISYVNKDNDKAQNLQYNVKAKILEDNLHKPEPSEKISSQFIQSLPIQINRVRTNNINNAVSAPLYLVLQNSETLNNPNCSPFFVIVNNNQQSVSSQKKEGNLIKNTKSVDTVQNTSLSQNVFKTPINPNSRLSNVRDVQYIFNKEENSGDHRSKTLNEPSELKHSLPEINSNLCLEKDAVLAELRNRHVLNMIKRNKGIEMKQDLSKVAPNPTSDIGTTCSIPVSSDAINTNYLNSFSTLFQNDQPVNNSVLLTKVNQSQTDKLLIQRSTESKRAKPIKNIPLGRHKNAIQQTSTPMRLDNVCETRKLLKENQYMSHIQNEVTKGLFDYTYAETLQKQTVDHNKKSSIPTLGSSNLVTLLKPDTKQLIANCEKKSAQSLPQSNSNFQLVTVLHRSPTYSKLITNQNHIPLNTHVSFINNPVMTPTSINEEIRISNIDQQKQQDSIEFPQKFKTLTFTDLCLPPITMLPVCVTPTPTSKVLILQGPNQENITQSKLQQPKKSGTASQKSVTRIKKVARKTVRELLEESRSKTVQPRIPKREIRVLRPLCKIPTETANPVTNTSTSNTNIVNLSANDHIVASSKRPNILVLPSALKEDKSNLREKNKIDEPAKCVPFVHDVTPIEDDGSLLSNFRNINSSGKFRRPRHYDMSELQIGYFKVEDDVDSYGRFRCKFKVLFTKRQFLYDFPVSRCNQTDLKTSQDWEQMARISVPFKTLASMSLRDRMIYIHVNIAPKIYLGTIQAQSGMFSNATVFDTPVDNDSTWGHCIRSSFNHKVVLRKQQASKLKACLYKFDKRFIFLTSVTACGNRFKNDSRVFEGELSPNTLKKSISKNRKLYVRRLPQWDVETAEQKTSSTEDLLAHRMCSCRTNCRSVRCSCVKNAKSCGSSGSTCQCTNCNNPLNVLESIGMDTEFSLKDSCLFQNIYQIPELMNYLQRNVKLECCNSFARVQDCIPGRVPCPNVNCNAELEYSWCHRMVSYPDRNPKNHCSFCGNCCFSNGRHCHTCKRCYVVSSKSLNCPNCQSNKEYCVSSSVSATESAGFPSLHHCERQLSSKANSKPEIILLDTSWSSKMPRMELEENLPSQDTGDKSEEETSDTCTVKGHLLIQDPDKLARNYPDELMIVDFGPKDTQTANDAVTDCIKIEKDYDDIKPLLLD